MRGQLIFLEASIALTASSLMLRLMPFRFVARLAGRLGEVPCGERAICNSRAAGVGRAINRAARRLPWHSNCLVRAIAGRLMLARRRIPSTLSFGVNADIGHIQAHAWLQAGGTVICGAAEMKGFAPIAEFVGGSAR